MHCGGLKRWDGGGSGQEQVHAEAKVFVVLMAEATPCALGMRQKATTCCMLTDFKNTDNTFLFHAAASTIASRRTLSASNSAAATCHRMSSRGNGCALCPRGPVPPRLSIVLQQAQVECSSSGAVVGRHSLGAAAAFGFRGGRSTRAVVCDGPSVSAVLLRMVTPPGPKKHRSASLEHVLRAEWLSAMLLRGVTPPGSRGGAGRPGLEVLGDAGFVDMIPENPRPGRVGKHGWNRRGGGEVWTC